MTRKSISIISLSITLLLAAHVFAQEKKDNQPEAKPAAEKSVDKNAPVDPYAVPDGTPKQLMQFQ